MTINEFIQENEQCMSGQLANYLYGLMCKGFLNDVTVESSFGDIIGVRAHLVFEGEEFKDVVLTIENLLLEEIKTFKFKLESVANDGPSRYRELN